MISSIPLQDLAQELARRGFRAVVRDSRVETNASREQVKAVMDALVAVRRADELARPTTRDDRDDDRGASRRAVKQDSASRAVRYG